MLSQKDTTRYSYQCVWLFSHVWLFATPWTVALQAPLSMGFPRQEYWSGLPFPSPWDLPHSGIKPGSPALQAGSFLMCHRGSPVGWHLSADQEETSVETEWAHTFMLYVPASRTLRRHTSVATTLQLCGLLSWLRHLCLWVCVSMGPIGSKPVTQGFDWEVLDTLFVLHDTLVLMGGS